MGRYSDKYNVGQANIWTTHWRE